MQPDYRPSIKNDIEIAHELGVTRANVGQTLKRALKKVHNNILQNKLAANSYEAFVYLSNYIGYNNGWDMYELYKKMPNDIKEKITEDARIVYKLR